MMLFSCVPVELDFICEAPLVFENIIEVDATPDDVFEVLTDVDSWPKWFSGMTDVKWLTDAPHGDRSQRQISLMGLVKVDETFLCWEPGKRFSFRFEKQNALLAKAAIEDIQLEPLGDGRCRVNYSVYMELPKPLSPLAIILKPVLGQIFKRGAKGLQKYLAK
ncbi:MAG: SRPBCC family protein [Candidatus Pelagadaptatus aseana]|uniref:SRPBCC family protein n=1 Tax=Candidatus Pelagadaptatus aseana TaxID=3120508 RepID=UPI0039B28DEB